MVHTPSLSTTDFTFRFAESTYTVNENGGFVDITVVTDMTTIRPFRFMLTAVDGTAKRKPLGTI